MTCFDRFAVCSAYHWFDVLWGPTNYGPRLSKIGFKPSCLSRLEDEEPEVKKIYGQLVRRREGAWVAFNRLAKRCPGLLLHWPGSNNVAGSGMWDKCANFVSARLGISYIEAWQLLSSMTQEPHNLYGERVST